MSSPQPAAPGHQAPRPLRRDPTNPTNSDFEDDFLAFVQKYHLPIPEINAYVNGRQATPSFRSTKLIVECDGWEFHSDRQAFEDDRARDADNLDHGHATVRITTQRLNPEPDREAARLQRILRQRELHLSYPKRPVT
jgi:hypothetical protein